MFKALDKQVHVINILSAVNVDRAGNIPHVLNESGGII
jgi:hypothetical protein